MISIGPHEGLAFHWRWLVTHITTSVIKFPFHSLLLQLKLLHMELNTAILKHSSGGLEGGPAPIEEQGDVEARSESEGLAERSHTTK